jgi:hypothetical protein
MPPVRLDMETLKIDRGQSEPLLWKDARLIIHWSRGFVWEDGGFAREWVWRDGDWCLEWKREGDAFRAKYKPLTRHVLSYETVGTRLTCSIHMGWKRDHYRGWIDFDENEVVRTGSRAPQYVNKPRATTEMLPFVAKMFGTWYANDRRKAAHEKWSDPEKGYVIHNGRGGGAWNLAKLIDDACVKLGIDSSSHKMKAASMTQHFNAGFDPLRAAELIGNKIDSAIKSYLVLPKRRRGPRPPPPDEATFTFVQLVDPKNDLPPMPRAPFPPRPSAPPEGV